MNKFISNMQIFEYISICEQIYNLKNPVLYKFYLLIDWVSEGGIGIYIEKVWKDTPKLSVYL